MVVRKRENTEVQIRGNKFIGKGRLAYEAGNERLLRQGKPWRGG